MYYSVHRLVYYGMRQKFSWFGTSKTVSKQVIIEGSYLISDSFIVSWYQTLLWIGTKDLGLANQRTVIPYRILANASAELRTLMPPTVVSPMCPSWSLRVRRSVCNGGRLRSSSDAEDAGLGLF